MNKRIVWPMAAAMFSLMLAACGQSTEGGRQATGNRQPVSNPQERDGGSERRPARSCQLENTGQELINLVVIAGNRANTFEIPVGSAADAVFCDLVGRTFEISNLEAQGNVAFVVSDGNPWQAEVLLPNGRPADLTVTANNAYTLNNRIENMISHTIVPFMDSDHLRANYPEADLLEALHEAQRILRDMDPGRESHILIMDSGITTAGHIDMRKFDVLEAGVATEIANRLETASLLPDLTGIQLSFFNVGGSAYPQMFPSGPPETALIGFWTEILEATGANLLQLQGRGQIGSARTVAAGYPPVSIVDFNVSDLDFSDLGSIVFSEDTLGFVADGSDFIDEQASIQNLGEAAQSLGAYLMRHPNKSVYIVGSQAEGPQRQTEDFALSEARAQRVKELFAVEFGLPADRMVAIGAGTTAFSWRNADEFANGPWSDELAQANRVVAIIPATSEDLDELRAQGFIY